MNRFGVLFSFLLFGQGLKSLMASNRFGVLFSFWLFGRGLKSLMAVNRFVGKIKSLMGKNDLIKLFASQGGTVHG